MHKPTSRRTFLTGTGLGAAALGVGQLARAAEEKIQGFEEKKAGAKPDGEWQQVFDRKIRLGIAGYGVCKFGAHFSLQDHPNVEVVAVSDLFPERRAELAKVCRCEKTYPSLEKMVEDDSIEAIFCATDAPGHARHAINVLKHGKHVASAVPAVYEHLEDADKLFEAVKRSGLNYMLFETSYYRPDLFAMRQIYEAGGFGKLVYTEGEYFHYACSVIDSYKDWRIGMPPQFYPTHSNAYHIGVDGGNFTEVSCLGMPSIRDELQPANNRYKNPFGTEIALFRTNEGGMSRMGVSWDTPGSGGEVGRVRGQRGTMAGMNYQGQENKLPPLGKPLLPPSVKPGGHGGSHGHLGHEFVMSILEDRKPLVDIGPALNMSVAGIVAHQSALKDGELLRIPQYKL